MVQIASTYSNDEFGWVSETFSVDKPAYIFITLKNRGRVAVKKSNDKDGDYVNVFTSPISGPDFEFAIEGNVEGKYIRFVTSEEPEKIEIWGDVKPKEEWYLRVSTENVWINNNREGYFNITSNTVWNINL